MNSCSAGFLANAPVSMARSIFGRSIQTMRPAPMLVCPTSELPICPSGSPTALPQAFSEECGSSDQIRSKFGVSASATAFASRDSRSPQPSRMHRTTGFGGLAVMIGEPSLVRGF